MKDAVKCRRLIVVVALLGASASPVSKKTPSNSEGADGFVIKSNVL
jgi:hypothetical protein